jgi:large subunit ribosomal protein L17
VRVIRTGVRPGDGGDKALIELVDFNELYVGKSAAKAGTEQKRKTRRGKAKTAADKTAKPEKETPVENEE